MAIWLTSTSSASGTDGKSSERQICSRSAPVGTSSWKAQHDAPIERRVEPLGRRRRQDDQAVEAIEGAHERRRARIAGAASAEEQLARVEEHDRVGEARLDEQLVELGLERAAGFGETRPVDGQQLLAEAVGQRCRQHRLAGAGRRR